MCSPHSLGPDWTDPSSGLGDYDDECIIINIINNNVVKNKVRIQNSSVSD